MANKSNKDNKSNKSNKPAAPPPAAPPPAAPPVVARGRPAGRSAKEDLVVAISVVQKHMQNLNDRVIRWDLHKDLQSALGAALASITDALRLVGATVPDSFTRTTGTTGPVLVVAIGQKVRVKAGSKVGQMFGITDEVLSVIKIVESGGEHRKRFTAVCQNPKGLTVAVATGHLQAV